jgi:hypothetical protein
VSRRARALIGAAALVLAILTGAGQALAAFPYTRPGGDPKDYTDLYLTTQAPNDVCGDGNQFKFASSPDPANTLVNASPVELGGVRGAHLFDGTPPTGCDGSPPTAASATPFAFQTTLGRPDVTIAVLDSGIKWNDPGAMGDLRHKVRLNRGELPVPNHTEPAPLDGSTPCSSFVNAYDANGDGVFNQTDYACDSHVAAVVNSDSRRAGPAGMLVPQDIIIAFSDGTDADGNGFVDDIAGWDFLDNDNDPFDDVQYGHGTGEASDSSSEADNGRQLGSCPNCMVVPLRVGDSFIADVNHFAQAAIYATDNDIQVVQEALGTLNNSSLARDAVDYAYRHGTTVIASAADEAAQHDNWPSSLPHVILVNSVTHSPVPPPNQSYLAFNGCTNFNSKVTLAIPSTSCSSNATGLAAGMAGLVYSAAYTAFQKGALDPFPDHALCRLAAPNSVSGSECLITPNEVRQVMASGRISPPADPGAGYQADDVNFAGTPPASGNEPSCTPPLPGCTDPNGAVQTQVSANRGATLAPLPPGAFQSYPARHGHDQFYGYGRVNMVRALAPVLSDPVAPDPATIPPDVEITSPQWYQPIDPGQAGFTVTGQAYARGTAFVCDIYVAPGHYPNNALATATPPGDFTKVSNGACDGTTTHTGALDGPLGTVGVAGLKGLFPPETQGTGFTGREPGGGAQTSNGRPNTDPYGFVVKVVARTTSGTAMTGEDQRAAFLHRDQDMLPGFPRGIVAGSISAGVPTGDGESSPVLADLNGDNRNELVVAGSDGFVHALQPDGSELPGWPVRGDAPPLHTGGRAFTSGEVSANVGGAILGAVAVGDANHDGIPEVYADDLEGRVYGWRADGTRFFTAHSNPAYSGAPLPGQPFVNPRYQPPSQADFHRTEHGFLASPVVADLDGDGRQEVIAAGMDRHVYAWHLDGSNATGFPLLVVDPSKVSSVDPQTDQVTFSPTAGSRMQGAIVDTPAVADIAGDARPEIVVGTNEEYDAADDGGFNAGGPDSGNLLTQAQTGAQGFTDACGSPCDGIDVPINPANTRLYALQPDGSAHGGGVPGFANAQLPGWPAKLGIVNAELLPVVGEGVTGYPVVGRMSCGSDPVGPKVGAMANNGEAYVFGPNGQSCYGRDSGHDIPLQTGGYTNQPDHPLVPAVGHPAFGNLDPTGGPSFIAPAAGLGRALDVAFPEYQRQGQDFLAAWSVQGGGQLRPNFPQPVNDLQFLTGPSVADIDGLPGEEVVEGTASKDLAAFDAAGAPVNQRWPKVTTDWTVANPTMGSFGTLDTDAGAHKVVIALTRSGYIDAYATDAPACSPGSWPRFHHDNANSGDLGRDATLPGKPTGLSLGGGALSFTSPGDDLMCGTPAAYEIATSPSPIDESSFAAARRLGGAPAPAAAGSRVSYPVPTDADRYVAVRAVDDQGNVGRVATVDLGPGGGNGGNRASGPCSNPIAGNGRANRLRGTTRGDRILGRGGRDKILGFAGDDCLLGGKGDDRLYGGRGRDRLRGNGGKDRLVGGRGPDLLAGGRGDDRLAVRGGGRDVAACGVGHDVAIVDRGDHVRGCEVVHRP